MNLLFFASLREQLNTDSENWTTLDDISTTGELLATLRDRGEPWKSVLANKQLLVSVNQEVSDWETSIKLGDEVALFPPVTGG